MIFPGNVDDRMLDAPNLDATWPAIMLSAFREVGVQALGWQTKVLAVRRWLPDSEWAVLMPIAFGGRSLVAGVFFDAPSANQLAQRLTVVPAPADDHEVGRALGEFGEDIASNIVHRRSYIAADMSAGVPMLCRGRVDIGGVAHASALQVSLGDIEAWLALIRPQALSRGIPGPLYG